MMLPLAIGFGLAVIVGVLVTRKLRRAGSSRPGAAHPSLGARIIQIGLGVVAIAALVGANIDEFGWAGLAVGVLFAGPGLIALICAILTTWREPRWALIGMFLLVAPLLLFFSGPSGGNEFIDLGGLGLMLANFAALGGAVGGAIIAAVADALQPRRRSNGRCPKCGYRLRGLTEPVCPECGEPLDRRDLSAASAAGS